MRAGFRFKGLFFDSPAVIKAVDDATYRALVRFGQYVRKVARHSIKTRPSPSAPDEPPHGHTGLLKVGILYGFDPVSRSAVIGPARIRGKATYGPVTVPELMEYGDTVRGRDSEMHRYEARPFMGPAFRSGEEKLDDFWRDSVK